jgi:Ca2+-binding RTX toxin-like protein
MAGRFAYTYVFDSTNWHQWAVIEVRANPDFIGTDGGVMAFAPQDQNLDQIRGPLIIEGGIGAGQVRVLVPPVLLPSETDVVSNENSLPANEADDVDVLNVFHTDNNDADTGNLSYRTTGLANPGLALTGFEMGGNLEIQPGVVYGGGITLNGFEIVEILLGKGNESLAISDTGDRDEKNPLVTADPATITAVHGGGGDDTITISNRGEGPLVVYGDTSQDGVRYSNNQPTASIHGTRFNNPGNDTIDATQMPDQADGFVGVVVYGGAGNDLIYGSQDDDHLAGGSGDDTIHAGAGNDHVYADSSFDVNLLFFARDQITPFGANEAEVDGMFTVDTMATAGGDTVHGDAGNDTVFGDHGVIDQVQGTRRLQTTGLVTLVATVWPANGMADSIYGDGGDDVLFGGNGSDTIGAGEGNNIVLGDDGLINYAADADVSDIDVIESTSPADAGGADDITSGGGQDIIIGGRFGDTIAAGNGDNLVIGDNGRITAAASGAAQLAGLPVTLGVVETMDHTQGGADDIATGSGRDIVLGGKGGDTIAAGEGNNIVLGDDGRIDYVADADASDIDVIESTSTTAQGGVDDITSGDGQDIIIGGRFGDTIAAGNGDNLAIGDNGRITAAASGAAQLAGLPITLGRIETMTSGDGGVDDITTGSGRDIVLGGNEGDTIAAGEGNNIVLGDDGSINYVADADASDIDVIESTSPTDAGGVDGITSGGGQDIIIGGRFGDTIAAGHGDNLVIGDSGVITAAATGAAQFAGLPITLGLVKSIATDDGGNDTIATGSGRDIVVGGALADTINAGDGDNIVFGDNGFIDYVGLDGAANDIDRLSTFAPTHGGADSITSGNGYDLIFGGTAGDTIHAGAGNDLVFGDHGKAEATATGAVIARDLPLSGAIDAFTFTSIDVLDIDLGGADTIHGEGGEDIIIGGQNGDSILAGADDDDAIGGHTIAGGYDGNDTIDGGAGADVIAGDNALVLRRNDALSPMTRQLSAGGLIYDANDQVLVTGTFRMNPDGVEGRDIHLFDHSFTIEAEAGHLWGNDYIAGGAGDDLIFGQLGNDIIQGDGSTALPLVNAYRDGTNALVVVPSVENRDTDGDDYVEGGGGNDVIFGNLGQDDLIGGSSDLFGLTTRLLRPDGSDFIFGGAGSVGGLVRNTLGDVAADGHAQDADVIAGDNATIYRLVGAAGAYLTFNYDNYSAAKIIPRAVSLLDYTPGGLDFKPAAAALDIGAGDELHGESGDDVIYGMKGADVLFGESHDDDLIGGYGHDWISAGSGDDGVLGDDGRIYTSRNGTAEPLYALSSEAQRTIATSGNHHVAVIFPTGMLNKTVNLTPFNVDGNLDGQDPLFDPTGADDIVYGGLGNDFLHGGSGDDAISGAEALALFYDRPINTGNVLRFAELRADEFLAYDEFNPMRQIFLNANGTPNAGQVGTPFLLNFEVMADGNDMLFGDLGNDWIVGGTGRDWMFGGYGADLMNADDDHTSAGGENTIPDGPNASYEDIAYGGAGRDVMIANTGGDRLIDWAGEFNSYLVPFSPFGMSTITRAGNPTMQQFLEDLSRGAGADRTRAADTGADPARNGEPEGEMGLVTHSDTAWGDQTGAPDDPQPGNSNGRKDVLRSADFNNGAMQGFSADSGTWTVQGGALLMSAETQTGDAVTIYHVGEQLPSYYELQVTINAVKPTAGWKANSYVIFDYHSPTDFKFAGIDVSLDKVVLGHRTASAWVVDKQIAGVKLKPDTFYNMFVAVNGLVATVTLDNTQSFSYAFAPRMIDGLPSNLNWGSVGFGSENARAKLDNIQVKVLQRPFTLTSTEDFDDGVADLFTGLEAGTWQLQSGAYLGSGADPAMSLIDLGLEKGIEANARNELTVTLSTAASAGFVFDRYSSTDFKFVLADAAADRVVIGHFVRGAWTVDASAPLVLNAGQGYKLAVSLAGSTVSVMVDDKAVVGHAFNAVVVDGAFGVLTRGGAASFDGFILRTSDSRFAEPAAQMLVAADPAPAMAGEAIVQAQLDTMVAAAVARWSEALGADISGALAGVVFVVGNLDGAALAQTVGRVVVIDADAAGWGWFVDATPYDDAEFQVAGSGGVLSATSSSAAHGQMDLLTVLMHEIGHVLGLDHDSGYAVMDESLAAGQRALPEGATARSSVGGGTPTATTELLPPPAEEPAPLPPPPAEEPAPPAPPPSKPGGKRR